MPASEFLDSFWSNEIEFRWAPCPPLSSQEKKTFNIPDRLVLVSSLIEKKKSDRLVLANKTCISNSQYRHRNHICQYMSKEHKKVCMVKCWMPELNETSSSGSYENEIDAASVASNALILKHTSSIGFIPGQSTQYLQHRIGFVIFIFVNPR